jgi:quercetin dioxygenase-like cupin family protein
MSSDRDAAYSKRLARALGFRSLGVLAAVLTGGQCAPAQSQTAATTTGSTARILESHVIPGTDREMVLREVNMAPGSAAPLHHHTVAGLVFIVEGVAESAYGSDAPQLYHAGETLQDRADIPHTLFRNADPNQPLRFLTFYVAAMGEPYLDERFQESCHMGGIHLPFQAPIYAVGL